MTDSKKIIVTGATGLIGSLLVDELKSRKYEVIVFTRNPEKAKNKLPNADQFVKWTFNPNDEWSKSVEGVDGIIHLAGANIFGNRWSDSYKKEILESRLEGTKALVSAIEKSSGKPKVFIGGSAVGFYGARGNENISESESSGNDFLATVCKKWEDESRLAEKFGVRVVTIRTGIVLDTRDGALKQLLLPFKLFAGGPVLPGTQWFSWVHIKDEIGLILHALENENITGAMNAVSPNPLTMKDFCKALGRALSRPSWAPVPGFALRLLLGEVASMLTTGQKVIPEKAIQTGYHFQFPDCETAIRNLVSK